METPIYLFTGFLESGKTTLIKEVVTEPDFLEEGTTLFLQCEEGDEPCGELFLKRYNMVKLDVEDPSEFNREFWETCERVYNPRQVIVEYNGMWELDALFDSDVLPDWDIGGIYSTVDATTAEMYLLNMRKQFMEQLKESNLIIFNRCTEQTDRMKFRRNLKAMNPQVQVAFEKTDGTMFANEEEELPFDYSGQEVTFEDMDYGLWYLDAMEHPDRYMGKAICFTARFCASAKPGKKYFVPGRHIMTCCEDDIQFLGFICKFKGNMKFKHGDWVKLTARFAYEYSKMYGEDGPVLYLEEIGPAEKPEQELVSFT